MPTGLHHMKTWPLLSLCFASAFIPTANAEISSLTTEELTDTYIKDTTVIVQQKQPEKEEASEPVPVTLQVTPLEKGAQVLPNDPTHSISSISTELDRYTDLNNQVAIDQSLLQPVPNATTKFLIPEVNSEAERLIRRDYNIPASDPLDLTKLTFSPGLTPDTPYTPGYTPYNTTDSAFTIRIPNTGSYNTQQISSPNGEIGVNVTPEFIEYTLNLPQ